MENHKDHTCKIATTTLVIVPLLLSLHQLYLFFLHLLPYACVVSVAEMTKMSSMKADGSVPKRRRQDVQKVVVSLKDHKVEQGPPADSWSWRKYGQKPIKGSPHPRGYYKCSSYRGCPARKQVDKCRNDASLLIITYTSDHNHDNYAATTTNSVQEQAHNPDTSDPLSNGMSLAEVVTVASSKLSGEEESCDFFDELEELPVSASPLPSLSFMVQECSFSDARTLL
uniref:WRKY transcription factor WRKY51 n=1 Tax=Oryza sativa subsp. japonica TaxID=39947 RepID=Q688Q4_ORYSJ|nr:putative WRKY transcription factor [Oryza sativa Japonica Group]